MDEYNFNKGKMSILEMIKTAFGIYIKKFKLIAIMTFLLYLPIIIVQNYLTNKYFPESLVEEILRNNKIQDDMIYSLFPYSVSILLLELCSIITTIAVILITMSHINKEKVEFNQILNRSFSFWLKASVTKIVASIIIFAGIMLFILPGLYCYILFVFILYAVVVKDLWGVNSLKYSANIVRANFMIVLGLTILMLIFSYIFIVPIEIVNSYIKIGIQPIDFAISVLFGLVKQIGLSILPVVSTVAFYNFDTSTNK